MQKLTKEQMLSELMVKLETIDDKLDKLLGVLFISTATGSGLDKLIAQRESIQDTEDFDEAYK